MPPSTSPPENSEALLAKNQACNGNCKCGGEPVADRDVSKAKVPLKKGFKKTSGTSTRRVERLSAMGASRRGY